MPGIPFVFLEGAAPTDLAGIEAALFGSAAREGRGFEPAACPRLRFVQSLYTGVDDLPFTKFPRSIEIAANSGGYAPFVAEHAVALALASARLLLEGHARILEGRIRPPPTPLRSFRGQTAVILGYGAIGQGIADRLRPFGATVEAVTRTGDPVRGCERVFGKDRLREALADGGFVFEARPLNRGTRGSIGPEELRSMPRDGTLVNVGRAATVEPEALYRHLIEVPSFRAAFDVWWEEDFAGGSLQGGARFAKLPNFVGSPHVAGVAPGAEEYSIGKAVENLGRFFRGDRPRFVVDRAEYEGR